MTSATLRLDHSPPSGGGSVSRTRTISSTSAVSRLGLRPLRRRPLARAAGPDALYRSTNCWIQRVPKAVTLDVALTVWPCAKSQITCTWRASTGSGQPLKRCSRSKILR